MLIMGNLVGSKEKDTKNSFMKYLVNKFTESCRDGRTFGAANAEHEEDDSEEQRGTVINTWLLCGPRAVKAIDWNYYGQPPVR